jgi:hypothetical protein
MKTRLWAGLSGARIQLGTDFSLYTELSRPARGPTLVYFTGDKAGGALC